MPGVIEAIFEYIFEKGRGVWWPWRPTTQASHTSSTIPWPNRPDWRLHYHNLTHHLTDEMRT
jgi:hypothetical protein